MSAFQFIWSHKIFFCSNEEIITTSTLIICILELCSFILYLLDQVIKVKAGGAKIEL